MGGYLTAIFGMKKYLKAENKPTWFIKSCLHRYLRFLPTVLGAVMFSSVFSGRAWTLYASIYENGFCDFQNLWKLLLFISTWNGNPPSSLGWLWYLCNDVWYHFAGLGIIWIISSKKKYIRIFSYIALIFLSLLSPVYRTTYAAVCGLYPGVLGVGTQVIPTEDHFTNGSICYDGMYTALYYSPWARCSAYFIGFSIGIFMIGRQNKLTTSWKLKSKATLLWLCGIGCVLVVIFVPMNYWRHFENWGRPAESFFYGFCHEIFALGTICIALACEYYRHKFWNPIRWILQHNFWVVLSKLNFSTYCIHYMIVTMFLCDHQIPLLEFTASWFFQSSVYLIVVCYIFGFFLYCLVEYPFAKIEDLVFSKIFR